ncbi:MAG: outer membrane beta-barrel protein [Bacteroidaceae bacterium]|nr:outer membrane beta-barrel protein [Bacteroidaceae bacterium]
MKRLFIAALLAVSTVTSWAGGLLTNTNQNIAFLRNPAQDGAININGVYSNPAGVVFLNEGFHLSLNWQAAWQTRTATTTNPLFALGLNNNGQTTKEYEGKAQAPFIPSIQAAYNTGKWSFMFNFAINGGGGKCEFSNGLGSFEGAVAQIGAGLQPFGAQGYNADYYMRGNQYYFGFTLGAAYKVTDNLSVFGGLRGLFGMASYKARISDIMVKTANGTIPFSNFLDATNAYVTNSLTQLNAAIPQLEGGVSQLQGALAQLEPMKDQPGYAEQYQGYLTQYQVYSAQLADCKANKEKLEGAQPTLEQLEVYRQGVNLQSDQRGFGIAPIIGVDYKAGDFNFGAKYEFRTKMGMKNESTLKEAMAIDAVNQFRDGTSVREDAPALLTVGGQYTIADKVRLNAGYHIYFDKDSKKYGNKQELLDKNTMEYLGGVEVDLTKKLTLSAGVQVTSYGMTDEYMSDLSFITDSWSFGLGAKYQVSEKVAINAAYLKTNYSTYKTAVSTAGIQNQFTRANDVIGVGVDLNF